MGRPPEPPERVRSCRVVTYVTTAELTALQGMAEGERKPLSAVVHEVLARALRDITEPTNEETNR